jgi:hypothetical protein
MALKLPRLPRDSEIVDAKGLPSFKMQLWWDELARNLETAFNGLEDTVAAVAAAQAAADAANAAASAADAAAVSAQSAADSTTAQSNLVNSYPDGATLSAADVGANVTVTVGAHDRVYGDATVLSVAGGTVTGQPYSTLLYIYYIDATRADATPTYLATTDPNAAAQTGDTHLIGSVTTPAAAAPPNNGNYVEPPGVGNIP